MSNTITPTVFYRTLNMRVAGVDRRIASQRELGTAR
jgi:hypothetical protein